MTSIGRVAYTCVRQCDIWQYIRPQRDWWLPFRPEQLVYHSDAAMWEGYDLHMSCVIAALSQVVAASNPYDALLEV